MIRASSHSSYILTTAAAFPIYCGRMRQSHGDSLCTSCFPTIRGVSREAHDVRSRVRGENVQSATTTVDVGK